MSYSLTIRDDTATLDIAQRGSIALPMRNEEAGLLAARIDISTDLDPEKSHRVATSVGAIFEWAEEVPQKWSDVSLRMKLGSVILLADETDVDFTFTGAINGYDFLVSFQFPTKPENIHHEGRVFISIDNLSGGVDTEEYYAGVNKMAPEALLDTAYEPFEALTDDYTHALLAARILELTLQH